jgi:glycosyltransferase involved in cell wall biosynthesis
MTELISNDAKPIRACIVIPCYNEAKRLRGAEFAGFTQKYNEVCFLFVNDGSKDETLSILQALCAQNESRLYYLDLVKNCGKAEAVRRGVLHATQSLQPQFIGFWDADLATPLEALPDFLGKLVKYESLQMVFGARVRLLGHHVKRKLARHYLGRLFATAVSIALQLPVYDTQCGAKLFRVGPVVAQIFAEPFLSRWIFDVEIVARVIQTALGDRAKVEELIYELPLMQWEDVAGSKLHATDFLLAIAEIYAIRRRYLR